MSVTVLQISDCHLGDSEGEALLGLNTDESLAAVLAMVKQVCEQPDLIVLTGDISNTGGPDAYARLIYMMNDQASIRAPMIWLPGNHDDNHYMQAAVGEDFLASKTLGHWQISGFDSSIPKAVPGRMEESELQRSETILKEHAQLNHLFFIHHHLKPVNCAWLDPQLVENADDVMSRWGQHKQLKVVAHGHVHQQQQQKFAHVDIFSTPSTCIQFKTDSDDFATGDEMPGFRVFTLHDDGSYQSEVYRISQRDLGIDKTASGY